MPRLFAAAATLALVASPTAAQHPTIRPAEQQVAMAVLPLPQPLRADATVLGYDAAGKLGTLRAGSNGMICLAPDPKRQDVHVACYHESMEPFMRRGRELRAQGVTGAQVDTVRYREVEAGTLPMPKHPAMLYSITGKSYDAATNTIPDGGALFVTYIPFATGRTTGLSEVPVRGAPWLMFPGTPKAHIMYVPSM
jgi:hypothetical protein